MGYEDGRAGVTGKIGEEEAVHFLRNGGFFASRPTGRDVGIDLIITHEKYRNFKATAQVKGRRQLKNPRWFQLSITPTQIKNAWERSEYLESLWKNKILLVDFWIMVSIPCEEIWIFPSNKVLDIAQLNAIRYSSRRDNQFDKPHYDKNGKIAKKQKELNLDIVIDGEPLWQMFSEYRNSFKPVSEDLGWES